MISFSMILFQDGVTCELIEKQLAIRIEHVELRLHIHPRKWMCIYL